MRIGENHSESVKACLRFHQLEYIQSKLRIFNAFFKTMIGKKINFKLNNS